MRTDRRHRGRRGTARRTVSAIVLGLGALVAASQGTSAEVDDGARLVLIDQTFVVPAGGPIIVSYDLDGDTSALERLLLEDLTPPPEPEPEPDTGTDTDDGETDADDGATDDPDVTPPAVPPRAWVVVRVHEPIDERGRVATALAGATGPTIDEVRIPLRDLVRPAPDGWSLEIDLATTAGPLARTSATEQRTDDTAPDGDETDDADGDRPALHLPTPGLHPLSIQVRTTDGRILARDVTFVERIADPGERAVRSQPFGISVVASLDRKSVV